MIRHLNDLIVLVTAQLSLPLLYGSHLFLFLRAQSCCGIRVDIVDVVGDI